MSSLSCHLPQYLSRLILWLISISSYVVFVHGQTRGIITEDVDDADPGIQYSHSGWIPVSNNQAFDKTEHLTRQQGTTANFTFIGIGIQVFGIVLPASFEGNTTISTYFLDDDQVGQSFTAPGNLTLMGFDTMFYQSPDNLSNGTHTLRIVNDNDEDWYIIDFLTVLSLPPNDLATSSTQFTFSASSTSSMKAISAGAKPSPSMKSSNDTNTLPPISFASRQTVSSGAAVGIALGGAIILGLFIVILLFIDRRRRRKVTRLARLSEYLRQNSLPTMYRQIDVLKAGIISGT